MRKRLWRGLAAVVSVSAITAAISACTTSARSGAEPVKQAIAITATAGTPLADADAQPFNKGFSRETVDSAVNYVCDAGTSFGSAYGVVWQIPLEQKEASPFAVSAWGKADVPVGGENSDYSIYLDIAYADGTFLWGQSSAFAASPAAGWQFRRVLIIPEKPVRKVSAFLLFRNHQGRARFKDMRLEKHAGSSIALYDGIEIGAQRRLAKPSFLVRDTLGDGSFHSIADGETALGLKLSATRRGSALTAALEDATGRDRAVTLYYVVPAGDGELEWFANMRSRERLGEGASERSVSTRVDGVGANERLARWPLAAAAAGGRGIALGIDPATPAFFRMGLNGRARELWIAFDFGLAPEKPHAEVRFRQFAFDAKEGLRGAFAEYMRIYPEAFDARIRKQGNWMPFAAISKVNGFEDFGFRFKEGDGETAWDDAHGILSFRYTEPMTWWMKMEGSGAKNADAAIAQARKMAAAGNRDALAWQASAINGPDGKPAMRLLDTPWCNGAVWSMNSAPGIAGAVTDWALKNSAESIAARYSAAPPAGCDGEYVDSAEAYVTAELDFRREHFAAMETPLCFANRTGKVGVYKGMIGFEYVRGLSREMHRRGRFAMANSTPTQWCWLAPLLDVLGTETNWNWDGRWNPMSDEDLMYRRSLCGAKPYCFLMNTDFTRFPREATEKYMKRCLAYGMFPGFFSADASTQQYFEQPALYERDRELFKKYVPLIRRIAEAGWEPRTGASSSNPRITLERFGKKPGIVYLTLCSQSANSEEAEIALGPELRANETRELATGEAWTWKDGRRKVSLGAGETRVVAFE